MKILFFILLYLLIGFLLAKAVEDNEQLSITVILFYPFMILSLLILTIAAVVADTFHTQSKRETL